MKAISPTVYLQEVSSLVYARNGKSLANLLKCSDAHIYNPKLALPEAENIVLRHLPTPWDEAVCAHMRCIWAMRRRDFEEAYACQVVVVKTVSKLLTEMKEENWILPVVLTAAIDLRRFAHGIDMSVTAAKGVPARNHGKQMETAAQLILRLFQVCASDSRTQIEDSKKLGMMGLANQLFKIYFQINKLNLCKSMIRAIENLSITDRFSLAQRVTYCYYVGRKAMFDGDFNSADNSLSFAFQRCLVTAWNNKRLILIYLIPVKMLLGVFPFASLLEKYHLTEFLGIAEAVKAGNLRRMDAELLKYEDFFLSCGVYLILEKLKLITYRNLFKKICCIMKTHLLPIEIFTVALKLMGVEDIDRDETECILANLIFEGKIKGYLAHQQQKLVVSKTQAFPTLNSTPLSSATNTAR